MIPTGAPPLPDDLEALLRGLRLPHVRRAAPEVLATAKSQRWEPAEVLRTLLLEERRGRDRSAIASRRAAACFPTGKTFASWKTPTPPSPRPPRRRCGPWSGSTAARTWWCAAPPVRARRSCSRPWAPRRWKRGCGSPGTPWRRSATLVRRHRVDDTVAKMVGRMVRADLIIVDDIGLLPVPTDAAEGLYRLVDAAYERRSIAVSSNLHPSGFDELMPKTLATATVDRLLHHAHLCVTTGDSVRLAQASSGAGVVPLTAPEVPARAARRTVAAS